MKKLAVCILSVWAIVNSLILKAEGVERFPMNTGWHFILNDVTGAEKTNFDDSKWELVTLPHCWGWQDGENGKKFYRGPGWYRNKFDAPLSVRGKRFFIRFKAAGTMADVYLNGHHLGQHCGGFGAFSFELTDFIKAKNNILAVNVSNKYMDFLAPLDADFNFYGGLYRTAELVVSDPVCFSPLEHGSSGIKILQTKISDDEATINIITSVNSKYSKRKAKVKLRISITDAKGLMVKQTEKELEVNSQTTVRDSQVVNIEKPHLWNGVLDPYLYNVSIELLNGHRILDKLNQPVGLRYYHVDPEKGFFLNGKPYFLKGVDRHQDREGKGWAISSADEKQDIDLIREMGANALRGAHYENSDHLYSLCDSAGILVWAEEPLVNRHDTTLLFKQTMEGQLKDLIEQNINHSSIFAWSLFNELDPKTSPIDLVSGLNKLAHQEDPTRLTVGAMDQFKWKQMAAIPDLIAWNIYPGWYSKSPDDYGEFLEQRRNTSREGGIAISEYGAGASIYQHADPVTQPKPGGTFHPEEWQNVVHETGWNAIRQRPYVWGSFIWNMFDFAVSRRKEGDHPGRNDKGLITFDRKVKKDVFYFYKANWTNTPVLYITSRRFTSRTDANTVIKVYSNCETVELFVNDISQGIKSPNDLKIVQWPQVILEPGENRIRVSGQKDGRAFEDGCIWMLTSGR